MIFTVAAVTFRMQIIFLYPTNRVAPTNQIACPSNTAADPTHSTPNSQATSKTRPCMCRYNDFEHDILDLFLNEVIKEKDIVLDIQPLSIDISPSKPKLAVNHNPSKSSGIRNFIRKAPKVTNSKVFKPL
ncbi:hypothetical protein RYX36_013362 [Vicia faba]